MSQQSLQIESDASTGFECQFQVGGIHTEFEEVEKVVQDCMEEFDGLGVVGCSGARVTCSVSGSSVSTVIQAISYIDAHTNGGLRPT